MLLGLQSLSSVCKSNEKKCFHSMFFSRFVHAGVCSFVTDTDVEPDDVRTESNVNVQAECLAVSRHAEDLSITVHVLGDVCFVCFTSVRLVVFCRVPT